MERNEETYMNFPIEETCEHDQSPVPLPLSKRRHVEELPNDLFEQPVVSEEEGQVTSGNVAQDLLDQESKPPSYEVPDLERREPELNQPSHQDIATWFNSVLGRQEIPPSEEDMPEKASFQPENNDKGQSVLVPCSPADSIASGSRRLRELQISHGPSTPQTPSTPIFPSQKPQTAQVVGNSELCAVCPIVDIRVLPSRSRSLEEICNGREILPDGGLAVYVALLHVVRKEYDVHQMMLSLFGSVGLQNVYLIMPSSMKERFQVFMTPDVERLSANFKTMDLEGDKHRKGRLDDVKALEPFVKLVTHLVEEAKMHVSQRIRENLKDALRICRKADNGSYMANVYQALEGNKDICLVEVHTGLTGHCEKFPIVCLEGEKILHVVEEWLMKNQKGRRLSDENIQLLTYDQPSYPVEESSEVFRSLHRIRLVNSRPSPALVQPSRPHGRGSGVTSHQQPAQFYNRYTPITYPQVGGVSSHAPNFGEISPHPSGYLEPNGVLLPPPPPSHHHGVPLPQNRYLGDIPPPPPIHHRDDGIRYHPPYPPSPSITGCGQGPTASVGPSTAYRPSSGPGTAYHPSSGPGTAYHPSSGPGTAHHPSRVSSQRVDHQSWDGTRH